MSSKFAGATMLNKTPPVCQKHEPGPDLPPDTIWPVLRSIITIYYPTAKPTEIWTQIVEIPWTGTSLIYIGSTFDGRGYEWDVRVGFGTNYSEVIISADMIGPVPPPFGQVTPERAIQNTFPIDTGQQELINVVNAERITARILV